MTKKRTEARRVVAYARVSLDQTGEGRSVERQLEAVRKLCDLRGWVIAEEIVDNSISAYGKKERPGWSRVLEYVASGEISHVAAWHIDRCTRSLLELEELIILAEDNGVGIATAVGDVDLSTDTGRMVARIIAAVARAEVERKAARQRLANAQAASAGLPYTNGVRSFGFESDGVTHIPEEAKAVRKAAEDVLSGVSLSAVAREWTEAGLLSERAKRRGAEAWTVRGVKRALTNPRVAGLRAYNGEVVAEGQWEPIITEEALIALTAKLNDPARLTNPSKSGRAPTTLLTGIAECGAEECSAGITGRGYRGVPVYSCRGSNHQRVSRDRADEWVSAVIVDRLSMPDALALLAPSGDAEADAAKGEAEDLRARLATLAEGFADGVLTQAQLTAGTAKIRARLAEVETVLSTAGTGSVLTGLDVGTDRIAEQWRNLPLDRRRVIVEALVTVRLHPKRGRHSIALDEEVEVTWKTRQALAA